MPILLQFTHVENKSRRGKNIRSYARETSHLSVPLLFPPDSEETPPAWPGLAETFGHDVYEKWQRGEKSEEICLPEVPTAPSRLSVKTEE